MDIEPWSVVSARLQGQHVAVYYYFEDECLSVRAVGQTERKTPKWGKLLGRTQAFALNNVSTYVSMNGYAKLMRLAAVSIPGKGVHHHYAALHGEAVPLTAAEDKIVPPDAVEIGLSPRRQPGFFRKDTGETVTAADAAYVIGRRMWMLSPR